MGSLYRLGQKFVDFCNVVQQNVSNALTVPSSKVLYDELENRLTTLSVTPSGSDEISFVEAVRLKMSSLGIQSFVGEMYAVGGSRYQGFAVFNDSFTSGSVMRVAFAGSSIFKYRYYNSTWTADEYVDATVKTKTVTTASSSVFSIFDPVVCKQSGRIVTIQVGVKVVTPADTHPGTLVLSGLPAPVSEVHYHATQWIGTTITMARVTIQTNGNLYVRGGTSGANYGIYITYITP